MMTTTSEADQALSSQVGRDLQGQRSHSLHVSLLEGLGVLMVEIFVVPIPPLFPSLQHRAQHLEECDLMRFSAALASKPSPSLGHTAGVKPGTNAIAIKDMPAHQCHTFYFYRFACRRPGNASCCLPSSCHQQTFNSLKKI